MKNVTDSSLQDLQKKFPAALNYLVSIFLIQREYGKTGNTRLADHLNVSKPAVNQAVGRLKKHDLVEQDPYGSIRLTESGHRYAAATLKKHYLIEHVLIKQLKYPWEKSDEEAQRLQTCLSEEFTDYLYDFFGQPETCPHGNPFPGSPQEDELINAPRLINAPLGTPVRIIRITEEGESVDGLLHFCNCHDLFPGKTLTLREKSQEDMLEVDCCEASFQMPAAIARHLCYLVT